MSLETSLVSSAIGKGSVDCCHPERAFASGCVSQEVLGLEETTCKVHVILMASTLNGSVSSNRVKWERSGGMVCQREGREVSL